MHNITIEDIQNCSKFSDTEKVVLGHMFKWEVYNRKHNCTEEVFILTNEAGLVEINAHELFKAIKHLVELGILKRRECDAIAYEWRNKDILLDYI